MTAPRREWEAMDDDVLLILWHNGRGAKWIARFMCCATSTIHRRAATLGLHKSEAFKESDRSGRILRGKQHPNMIARRFKPGLVPWNKGTHYVAGGRSVETRFKKGHLSGRAAAVVQPIGAERVGKDGILQRKVNNDLLFQRRWKAVHAIVWEEAHGPIPPGHLVVFRDHDRRNFDPANLELVTWEENMRRNSYHNRYPKEVARLIQLKGALIRKVNRKTRQSA